MITFKSKENTIQKKNKVDAKYAWTYKEKHFQRTFGSFILILSRYSSLKKLRYACHEQICIVKKAKNIYSFKWFVLLNKQNYQS